MSDTIENQLKALGLMKPEPAPDNSLVARLKSHDWTWQYSDQYLRHAANEERKLRAILKERGCSAPWGDIYAWMREHHDGVCDMDENGKWWSPTWRPSPTSAPINNVLTFSYWEKIDNWMKENGY